MEKFDPARHLALYPADRWLFRWVFEFHDGRPARRGQWHPATKPQDMAQAVDKRNLLWSYIEGKHWTTKEVRKFGECPGPEFVEFKHLAVMFPSTGQNHVYGMQIVAKDHTITALENGTVSYESRNEGSP